MLGGFALSGFVALVLVMLCDLGIWFVCCGFCGLRGLWRVGGCACSWLALVCWAFALRCMAVCFDVGGFDSWFGGLIAVGCVTRVGWCGYCWFVCGFAGVAGIYGGDFGLDSVARFVWCLCLVVVVSSAGVGFVLVVILLVTWVSLLCRLIS